MFLNIDLLLLCIVCSGFVNCGTAPADLSFIALSTGNNPIYGHISSEPGYSAAYNRLKPLYPKVLGNSKWHSLYYPGGNILCGDAAVQMELMAGGIYDLLKTFSGFPILLSTGCSLEVLVMGDYAREWDVPLFSSTSGDIRLANKQRFPTVISGSGGSDYTSLALAVEALLDKFRWRTLTFLLDLASNYPGVSNYYPLSYANIKAALDARWGKYAIYTLRFNSGDPDYMFSVDDLLHKTKTQSRSTHE
ncbi:hypothetical protein RvY_16547 [Ramazzottius varieornatus]|uniref:Receptor ligand binding region domain-containing protein n=1 Tax=Ramazzottius varieornatus TaxID=947166 RepID=A0A1D1VZN4_RAMVA|nr:hypothetical protein RvY_16547 [Ramazzottius varieornatus]